MDRGAWWTTVHGVAKSGTRDVEKGYDHLALLGGEMGQQTKAVEGKMGPDIEAI